MAKKKRVTEAPAPTVKKGKAKPRTNLNRLNYPHRRADGSPDGVPSVPKVYQEGLEDPVKGR